MNFGLKGLNKEKVEKAKNKLEANTKLKSLTNTSSKKNYLENYLTKKDPYSLKIKEEIGDNLKMALKDISLKIVENDAAGEYQKHLTRLELINKLKSRIKKMKEFKEKIEIRKKELVEEGFDENDVYDEFDEEEVLGDEDEIDIVLKEFLDEGKFLN